MHSNTCPSCGTPINDEDILALGICPACDEFLENHSLSLNRYSLDDIATLLSGNPLIGGEQNESATSPQTSPIRVPESVQNLAINYSLNAQTDKYEYEIEP